MNNLTPKTTSSFASFFKTLSKLLTVLVVAGSFLVLVGWQFDIMFLKNIRPNLPLIAPNSALCLFLLGLALWLANLKNNKARRIANGLAALVLLTGVLTLFEYIFSKNLGIDQLIFRHAVELNGLPIRMSPQSAVNFLVIGLSLALIDVKTRTNKYPSQFLILVAAFLSFLSLFGHIYSVPSFYTISPYKGMAAHTAVFFTLLFFGVFTARPDKGLMRIFSSEGISGFVSRRLLAVLLIVSFTDFLVMFAQRAGYYEPPIEALMHITVIIIAFIYLIFIGFGSLNRVISLEEIDRAKSEFVSFVSHQLRSPLTAIKWGIEALLKKSDNLDKEQKESLEEINQSASRMINLTNAFLDISRIEMGGFTIEARRSNIKEVVRSIMKELSAQIEEKKINIVENYGEGLKEINIDPKLVQIVLHNLLTNAVKYTPANGKIELSLEKGYHELKIKVADSGAGIPQDQQKFVFAKLFRGANIKEKTEGSGVGLYMVKNLLDRINGEIWFESQEGQGTTFHVTIPF